MSLNEAAGYQRSNLTKEQKRDQEAVLYGLDPHPVMDLSQLLTPENIEQLRTALAQHDSQGKINEFDLNNPPVKPYAHQAYPKVIYHPAKAPKKVDNAAQHEEHLDDGWANEPFAPAPLDDPKLDAATKAEVKKLDKEARKPKSE